MDALSWFLFGDRFTHVSLFEAVGAVIAGWYLRGLIDRVRYYRMSDEETHDKPETLP